MDQKAQTKMQMALRSVAVTVGLHLASGASHAATVSIDPVLQVSEIYTDNVALASPGDEEDDFITQIVPGISYSRVAPRLDLVFNYQLEYLWYANDSDRNDTFHQAGAYGEVVAVPEWFFIDAGAGYSQTIISPEAPVSVNNLSVTDNRTNASTVTVNPYLHHRFSDQFVVRAEYQVDRVDYDEERLSDSRRRRTLLRVGNDEEQKYRWNASTSRRVLVSEDREDTVLNRSAIFLGRRFSSRLSVGLEAGYEDNEYGGVDDVIKEDGSVWLVNADWAPNTQTTLAAAYGRRVFGNTFSLSADRQTNIGQFHASYSEDYTSEIERIAVVEPERIDETGTVEFSTSTGLDNEVYLSRRLRGGWSREKGRTDVELYGYEERLEYQITEDEEELGAIGTHVAWRMAPRTTLLADGELQKRDFRDIDRTDYLGYLSFGVERRMTHRITGELRYRYTERDSTADSSDYQQNMLFLTARAEF